MVKAGLIAILFCLPLAAHAEIPHWNLVPEKSSIRWEATQNHAPVAGKFDAFTAEIAFHPDALGQSHVKISIDTASITTAYDEAQSTLKTADWFAVDAFGHAIFETTRFSALGDNHYQAEGNLTIKGISAPVVLNFTMENYSDTEAHMLGEATLKRTDFNIGWKDTQQVEDNVKVMVEITASR